MTLSNSSYFMVLDNNNYYNIRQQLDMFLPYTCLHYLPNFFRRIDTSCLGKVTRSSLIRPFNVPLFVSKLPNH